MSRKRGYGFGTAPVFLAAISTILGAILFLRFGYAVGSLGLVGTFLIIFLGHLVTLPTGLAVSEIASNLKVQGGGEYFIISRTFGIRLGATIGISLYLSEVISVAFYLIAFAEAFRPLSGLFNSYLGVPFDPRFVSLPAALILISVMLKRGASIGVNILWMVASTMGIALLFFLFGHATTAVQQTPVSFTTHVGNPDSFFKVFSIVFPAFTGVTAGVGLSGDLKNPGKSIPRGTIAAVITGFFIYLLVILKLQFSATSQELVGNELIMQKIAVWGPIIPIGLAAATLSSAIGSILVAPRTLQALAKDGVFPFKTANRIFLKGKGAENEPKNAVIFSSLIVLIFVAVGSVNAVARIITMFFLITYGALCFASFFEHFAARPAYRPVFHSRWYLSLLGGIMSLFIMFQLQHWFALLAIFILIIIYWSIGFSRQKRSDVASIFRGALFQIVRWLRLALQSNANDQDAEEWWPSVLAISGLTLERTNVFDLLRWISNRQGFGTYIHFIPGQLSSQNREKSQTALNKLLKLSQNTRAHVFLETIIAPTFTSALANIIQVPGVSGLNNNTVLLDFKNYRPNELNDVLLGSKFANAYNMNICMLRVSDFRFGVRDKIDIWLERPYYSSGNLMILLSFIIKGHADWRNARISIYAPVPKKDMAKETRYLYQLISEGRLPISRKNIQALPFKLEEGYEKMILENSAESDLVLFGYNAGVEESRLKERLIQHPKLRDVLFVCANQKILIS